MMLLLPSFYFYSRAQLTAYFFLDVTYDTCFSSLKGKYQRYKRYNYPYVEIKPTLYLYINYALRIYKSLTRRIEYSNSAKKIASARYRVRIAYQSLTNALCKFDNNYNKMISDMQLPKKGSVATMYTNSTSLAIVAKMQNIRRGIFAIVEIGKLVRRFPYTTPIYFAY